MSALEGPAGSPARARDVICGLMTSLKTYAKDGVEKKVMTIAMKTAFRADETDDILRVVL